MCNLLHTCYLCLTVDPQHKSLIPLYDRNREETQRIRYVLPELVLLGPDARPFICYMCVETLTSFYLFKRKCLENNYHLMCILNKQLQHPQQRQLQQQQLQKQMLLQQHQQQRYQQQEQLQQQNYQQQQQLLQQQQQQKKQIQEKHQQPLKQLQRRHEQQQLNNVQVLQFPQQRHFETRPEVSFRNSIINPSNDQHTSVQNKPAVEVTNTVANVALFDYNTGRNYLNLTEKQTHVEKRAEPVLNNEFMYHNLQMQDPSPLSANQINSVDRNNVVTQLCNANDKQAQQKDVETRSRVTEKVVGNELSKVHTQDYSALYNNATSNETNVHLTKIDKDIRRTEDVETVSPFCDRTNDKQLLINEQNGIAKRTSESPFDAELECKNQETQDSFIFEVNLDSFSDQQQTNQQRDIKRSNVEAVFHSKLKCPKVEVEDSDLIPEAQKNSLANNIEVKENVGSFYNQLLENEQKDSENKLDAVIHNELKFPKQEVEDSDLIPEAQKNVLASNIDFEDYFDPFYDQQLTNEQKDIERKKLEAVYDNELKQSKLEFEDSVSVSEAQINVQVNNINIKENFDYNRQVSKQIIIETKRLEEKFDNKLKNSKPDIEYSMMLDEEEQLTDDIDVKENIASFYKLTKKQKYIESRRLEEIYQNELKCSKQKIEDLDFLSHKNFVGKDNSHTQQLTNEQQDFGTRKKVADEDYLPSFESETEDSDSLSEEEENNDESFASFHAQQLSGEQEDSETRDVREDSLSSSREEFVTEDFIIKEEFAPYYSTGTKFYQELENNLRSVPITNNPLLSVPSSETNIVVNNIFKSFYNSIPGSKPYNTNKWNLKNSDKVKCPICTEEEVVVLMPNHLRWHVAMKHFDRIKCSICKAELLVGMMYNHRKFHFDVKCPVCNKEMLTGSLKHHKHKKCTKCTICHKQFKSFGNFETHKKMHVEEWKFECKICNKKFFLETHLKSHTMQAHADNKFECNICNKIYTHEPNFTRHKIFHTKEPPTYKCSYCGQMFVRQNNLIQHEKIHVGVKEYECATCGKKFLHKGHLKQHLPTHAGLKKFECSICNKAFLRKCSLSKHMETHRE